MRTETDRTTAGTTTPKRGRRTRRTLAAAALVLAALLGATPAAQAATTTTTFGSTGGEQTFTVPAGTTTLTVTAVGGNGTDNIGTGGLGARVDGATLGVVPGQVLYVEVGRNGGQNGFNGGGTSGVGTGGGASDLRSLGRDQIGSLSTRLLVVPGGGSGSYMSGGNWESPGTDYCPGNGGGAGTATAGGAGGAACVGLPGMDGSFGAGGNGGDTVGGAGGGGWYGGGGGGQLGGGGGGSRFVSAAVTNTPPFSNGDGNPRIVLTYEVNEPPVVTLTGSPLAYAENAAATAVDGALTITDPDNTSIASAEVKLTDPQPGDELSYVTTSGIAGTVNVDKDTVTFSATGTTANYQAALRAVRFRNTSDTPSTTARSVRFKASDGVGDSNLPVRTINVTAVNDVPELAAGGGSGYAFRLKWGTYGAGNGQLSTPYGMEVDADGNLWVAEGGNNRVQKFSPEGTYLAKFGTLGAGNGQFSHPADIAFDATGNFYVTEWDGNRVQKFAPDGTFIAKWGTAGSGDGQFNHPLGVEVGPDGNVYVGDAYNNRVQKFSPAGAFIAKWGTSGTGDGQFQLPYGIEIDAAGNVYVGEAQGGRIQKFTATGTFLTKWGSTGSAAGQLAWPMNVALDAGGNLLVPEASNHRVQKFGPGGALLASFGAAGSADGRLSTPGGVAVDAAGNVYVSEVSNNRISKFAPGPGPLAYTEGQAATTVLPDLTAADADHANLSSATASITAGHVPSEDVLGFSDQNGITGSYNAAGGVMTLTGSATVEQYRDALRSVTYRNTSIAPSTATRTISFRASDGAAQGTIAAREVKVTAVNSTPTVTTTSTTFGYTAGQAATAVDPAVAVADIDNPTFISARVQITSGLSASQDVLALAANPGGIFGSYNAASGTLTLSGTASLANYQAALRSVTYRNASLTPSNAARTVRFTVNDGAAEGFGTRSVAVTTPPIAPSMTTTASALAYTENDPAAAVDTALTVTDLDSPSLASARVSISANLNSAQDVLAFANAGGISGAYDAESGVLTLTGAATLAQYQAALRSVTYRNTSDAPTVAARTVSFVVNDGTLNSPARTRQIVVTAVNDRPVITRTSEPLDYVEQSGQQVFDSGIEVTDPDSATLTSAYVMLTRHREGDSLKAPPAIGLTSTPERFTTNFVEYANSGTVASYRAALRSIRFVNTSSDPSSTPVATVISVSDGIATTQLAGRAVAISRVNDSPTAGSDRVDVSETNPVTLAAPGVLGNDSDVDGPPLTVGEVAGAVASVGVQQTTAKGAKVTIGADGALAYDPNGRFAALNGGDFATDTVTYKATDGTASSGLATVTFTINGVGSAPVAVKDFYAVGENASLSTGAPGVLANDAGSGLAVDEVDGGAAKVGVQQTTAKGAKVAIDASGALSYDPNGSFEELDAGETATDTVTYRASDADQPTRTVTVTLSIAGANDAPVAADNAYAVGEDAPSTRPAPGVLGNDTDADEENTTVAEVQGSDANVGADVTTAAGATVRLNADGSLTYDPNGRFEELDAGESATDSVAYKTSDGTASSATATVTFTIDGANDAPDAVADGYAVGEDATLDVPASGVLANDSDADDEPVTVGEVAGAAADVGVQQTTAKGAKVTISANGSVSYDPNGRFERLDTGESDTDSIAYKAADGTASSPARKVTFTIGGANDAPSAGDDAFHVSEKGTLSQPAGQLLANDYDVDIEPLSVGEVAGDSANVGVELRTAKDAKFTINADGSFSYDPDNRFLELDTGETDTDTVTYRAADGDASSDLVTVTVTVHGANDDPTAIPDAYLIGENGNLAVSADGLAGNDGDVDQELLRVTELEGSDANVGVEQTTAKGAKVTVTETGSVNYDPNGRFEGLDSGEDDTDSFTYRISDEEAESNLGTATITIIGANDAPTAAADTLSVGEDAVLSEDAPGVLANDDDVDVETIAVAEFAGDPDLVGVQQTTAKGAKVTLEPDGAVRYDPNGRFESLDTGETETDAFEYRVSDGSAAGEPVTATVTIQGANDAPSAADDAFAVGENATLAQPAAGVLGNDEDVDVESLTVGEVDGSAGAVGSEQTTAAGAKVTIDADGALAYDPDGAFEGLDSDEAGTDSIAYRTSDGTTTGNTAAVTFSVAGANDAPVAVDDGRNVAENEVLTVEAPGLLGNDSDPDVEALEIDRVAGDAANVGVVRTTAKGATLVVSADGSVTYDPNGRFEGLDSGESETDSVTYRVTDGDATSNVATLTITIDGANDVPLVTTTVAALPFDQGDAAKAVDSGLTLADGDDTDFNGARVTLTDPHPGDELSYAPTTGVTAVVNLAHDTVTFSGAHPLAGYQAALRAVRFFNGANNPSGADRHVTFTVNDGEADSESAARTIDFTLDTTAPDTEITSGPSGDTGSAAAAFGFAATAANPGGTLRCRLDGPGTATAAYADCGSPSAYADLADGAYTFRAYAVDAAGNADGTPATRSFRVDTAAPVTTDDVPAAAQAVAVTVTLSATDANGSAVARTYYTQGATPADPTLASTVYDPAAKPALANGERIAYFSTDNAGNREAVKSSRAATVTSTTAPTKIIRGTDGDDTITGTAGDDVIYCGAGNDVVNAGAGNDVIDCGAGNDRVNGGAGNDLVYGRRGNDRLVGSSGNDSLLGAEGDDRLSGGTGKDRLRGSQGRDELYGQAGNDRLSGGTGVDRLIGADGHDRLSGDAGKDRVWGGEGNDRLYGQAGDDRLSGGPGDDRLTGGAGVDTLLGGAGMDRLIGGPGIDVLLGGPGVDTQEQ